MKHDPYYLNKKSYLNISNNKIRRYMINKKIFRKSRIERIRKRYTLLKHLDNYYNNKVVIIQRCYRSYLAKKKFDILLSKKFNNSTNLIGIDYVDIPKIFRYHLDKYFLILENFIFI